MNKRDKAFWVVLIWHIWAMIAIPVSAQIAWGLLGPEALPSSRILLALGFWFFFSAIYFPAAYLICGPLD